MIFSRVATLLQIQIRSTLFNFLGISSRRLALEDAAYVLQGYPFFSLEHSTVKCPVTTCEKPALKIRESVTVLRGISGAIKRSV